MQAEELPDDSGGGGRGGWVVIHEPPGSQGCPPGSKPTPGWTWGLSLSHGWNGKREPTLDWMWGQETTEGWTESAGTKERALQIGPTRPI